MRKIIFRGKRIRPEGVEDAWAYGSLIQRIDTTEIHDGVFTWNIHPDTIGQFTGLTDKNGKEIYEGDICKIKWFGSNRIDISAIKYVDDSFILESYEIGLAYTIEREIIGNIHDNPELLTSK